MKTFASRLAVLALSAASIFVAPAALAEAEAKKHERVIATG